MGKCYSFDMKRETKLKQNVNHNLPEERVMSNHNFSAKKISSRTLLNA